MVIIDRLADDEFDQLLIYLREQKEQREQQRDSQFKLDVLKAVLIEFRAGLSADQLAEIAEAVNEKYIEPDDNWWDEQDV